MIYPTPHLIIPPERPALVRASDLRGLPSWQEAIVPFAVFPPPISAGFKGVTAAGTATITTHNNFGGAAIRIIIAGANVSNSGTQVRLTLRGPDSVGPTVIDNVYAGIGLGDASGSFAATPTEFKFSGVSGCSLPNTTDVQSDITNCTITSGTEFVVSFNLHTGTNNTGEGAEPTGWTLRFKSGAADAGTQTASGYGAPYGSNEILKLVEC